RTKEKSGNTGEEFGSMRGTSSRKHSLAFPIIVADMVNPLTGFPAQSDRTTAEWAVVQLRKLLDLFCRNGCRVLKHEPCHVLAARRCSERSRKCVIAPIRGQYP